MRINNDNQNFKGLTGLKKPLGTFYNPNAVLPTLLIETGVTLGRSYEANKRGGKIEATERFVEQGVSAVVWLWGVQFFQKIGEKLGKKLFKIDNFNFDVGRDILRNPIKNNNISAKASTFKAVNILAATALATYFIGFVLPKINHLITNRALKKEENKAENNQENKAENQVENNVENNVENKTENGAEQVKTEEQKPETKEELKAEQNIEQKTKQRAEQKETSLLKPISIEQFKNDINSTSTKEQISFTSNKAVTLAHVIENNSTARLLITDLGVISGRSHNARNKYEKIENIFRDTASVYFYLFAPKHFVKLMNKFSKTTDIDPKALNQLYELLDSKVKEGISHEEFLKNALGCASEEDLKKVETLFKGKKIVDLESFLAEFPLLKEKAQKMTDLQPVFENKRFLTQKQAKDVVSNGWLTDPEFLKTTFNKVTKGASDDPLRYVSKKKLETIRASLDKFVEQVAKRAKDKKVQVDSNFIKKVANKNIRKSLVFQTGAIAIATTALGILIPKIQYAITTHLTNKNEFPGVSQSESV